MSIERDVLALYMNAFPTHTEAQKRELEREAKQCSELIGAIPPEKRVDALTLLAAVMDAPDGFAFFTAAVAFEDYITAYLPHVAASKCE